MPTDHEKRTPGRAMMEAQIDENLRKIFEEDLKDDVPEHLRALVARLGETERGPQPKTGGLAEQNHDDSEEADR
ncbi:NepR family anti-sigma factor [Histidinibacterium lentulum]|nr:NepR family anti-sigma factor [Histidinibacterium lentulum]